MPGLGRVALAVASILFALALGEGVVRVAGLGGVTRSRGPLHDNDPELGWICARGVDTRYELPGSFDVRVRCNELGLRDLDTPELAKPAGQRRVAVLGDSFMWGFGVENEELLSEQLEALLPDTEAISFAANGYGTIQSLLRFERDAAAYAPDWTLLFFCWNDLEDNFDPKDGRRPYARLAEDGRLAIENSPVARLWSSPLKQALRQHLRLFELGDYAGEVLKAALSDRQLRRELRRARETRVELDGPPSRIARIEIYVEPGPKLDTAWRAVRLALARLDRGARQAGGQLAVAWVPTPETVLPEAFTTAFHGEGGRPLATGLDWDRPARRLARIAAELGIDHVETLPVFRAAEDPERLFLVDNGHWSPAGHALAARQVAAHLRRAGTE